ncbi:MAG TPA: hypothetical protein VHZ24_22880 [Pirellulales bacterium]|nr:hypothetical protein [Pirellulales bacterium]
MSKTFKQILQQVGEGISQAAPGLSLENILSDVGAELSRLEQQGRSEVASALYTTNGFVLYGPGQDISKHHENAVEAPQQTQIEEQSRGMEM